MNAPNYRQIITKVVEDGIKKGLYSLENEDLENISEEELIKAISKYVIDEIHEWFSLEE
jgi:hypothetical protein